MDLYSMSTLVFMLMPFQVLAQGVSQISPDHRPSNLSISVNNANITNTHGKIYTADLQILLHGLDSSSNVQEDSANHELLDELTRGMVRLGKTISKLTETVQNVMEQLPDLINKQITIATTGIPTNTVDQVPGGAEAVLTSPICPDPFFSVSGECFYANVHQKLSWAQARHFCEGVGSELAEPRDVNLLRLMLQEKFLSKTVVSFWLGAKKFKVKTGGGGAGGGVEWQWLSGLPVGDSNWIRGQPDNRFGDEDCLAMMKGFQPPLHDITCSHVDYFICERKSSTAAEDSLTLA